MIDGAEHNEPGTRKPGMANRKQRRDEEKDERDREKRRSAKRERDKEKDKDTGGIKCLPLVFLVIIVGPGVGGAVLGGMEYLGTTDIGKSLSRSCVEFGICSSYADRLRTIYEYNEQPKKIANIPKLLKKWKGREGELLVEVEKKYEQRRRIEAIKKAAMERDKKEQESGDFDERDSKRGKPFKVKKSRPPPSPTPKAAGWDDEEEEPPMTPWDVEEDEDMDDIMAETLRNSEV
jgi:hypothetical protein